MGVFLVLVPLLVQLGTLLALGTELDRLPGLLFWGVLSQAGMLMPMVLLAALTPNLAVYATGYVAAFLVFTMVVQTLSGSHWPYTGPTRRTRQTLAVGLAVFVLLLIVDFGISSDFLFPMPVRTAEGLSEERVSVAFKRELPLADRSQDGEMLSLNWADTTDSDLVKLLGFLDVAGPPAGYVLETRWVHGQITYPDGSVQGVQAHT